MNWNQLRRFGYSCKKNRAGEGRSGLGIKRDMITYSGADSGCKQATDYLGYQSSCLECPFPECVLGKHTIKPAKEARNNEIKERYYKGETIDGLAKSFGICKRTIERVLNKRT